MGGQIRIGVGGWTYEPWRGTWYPADLPRKGELEYASRKLTSIEINGTFYRSQAASTFAKWRDETPDGFVFALKAPRYATHRGVLSEAESTIKRFVTGGLLELKDKLGPINWQLMPTTQFNPRDLEGFLKLLPKEAGGRALRHALEVRHESFHTPEFVDLARRHEVAIVVAGDSDYPRIPDPTAPFIYARIMGTQPGNPQGYSKGQLDQWSQRAKTWAEGGVPEELGSVSAQPADRVSRDVFMYVISGHKVANPAAAQALIERVA